MSYNYADASRRKFDAWQASDRHAYYAGRRSEARLKALQRLCDGARLEESHPDAVRGCAFVTRTDSSGRVESCWVEELSGWYRIPRGTGRVELPDPTDPKREVWIERASSPPSWRSSRGWSTTPPVHSRRSLFDTCSIFLSKHTTDVVSFESDVKGGDDSADSCRVTGRKDHEL